MKFKGEIIRNQKFYSKYSKRGKNIKMFGSPLGNCMWIAFMRKG